MKREIPIAQPDDPGQPRHDAAEEAASAVAAWASIHAALSPVVGARGVAALYRRVVFLASTEHPWLRAVAAGVAEPADFALLHAAFLQQDGPSVAAAQQQMLYLFHDLLVRLIGAPLADRLLPAGSAFPSAGPLRQDTSP